MGARLIAGLCLLAVALVGCGGSEATDASPGEVVELTELATLEAAFAAGEGKPRLLMLLSPT